MVEPYRKSLYARWGDMDFNGHMKNTAYLDASGDVRMMYFSEHGFSMREFERLKMGPVILRDDLEYFKELRLLEPVELTLAVAGMTEDGSRFRLRNEFFKTSGQKAASVTSLGGWLDFSTRRMAPPPPELHALMNSMVRTKDFVWIERRGKD